jgi:hypothetical protein
LRDENPGADTPVGADAVVGLALLIESERATAILALARRDSPMAQARCPYCGRWFKPVLRKGPRQVSCGSEECRLAHKRMLGVEWRKENPERSLGRQGKVRVWAGERDYWRDWREDHPDYVERNRERTRERMRRLREERRKAKVLLADPVGYLRGVKALCGEGVCKTGTGPPQKGFEMQRNSRTADAVCKTGTGREPVVEVVDYLLARELFAKQEGLDAGRAAAG